MSLRWNPGTRAKGLTSIQLRHMSIHNQYLESEHSAYRNVYSAAGVGTRVGILRPVLEWSLAADQSRGLCENAEDAVMLVRLRSSPDSTGDGGAPRYDLSSGFLQVRGVC